MSTFATTVTNDPLDVGETQHSTAGATYHDWASKPNQLVFKFDNPSDFHQLEQKLNEANFQLTTDGEVQAPEKAKIEVLLHGLISMASDPDYLKGFQPEPTKQSDPDTPTSEFRS